MIIPDVFDTDDCYVRPLNGLVFAAGYRVVGRSKYESKSPSRIKSYLAGAAALKGVRPASDDVCHAVRNLKVGQATSEFLGAYVTKFFTAVACFSQRSRTVLSANSIFRAPPQEHRFYISLPNW
jgi:hypothetical protein